MISKKIFDFLASFFGLIVLLPLFLLVSVLILLSSKGPVFFKQTRVGQHGKPFKIIKFRTMRVNYDKNTVSVKNDSRITGIGGFLRKFKLDELPELINVLKGEMSLVGPRPDVPGYADKLQGEDRIMLKLKPGITGPASLKYIDEEEILAKQADPVKYNNEVLFPDKVIMNIKYYHQWSFCLDLKIILYTLTRKKFEFDEK
jgi:lipopolysaccharide/colanic/teichoic acid biosynthesis glycosyltransferase